MFKNLAIRYKLASLVAITLFAMAIIGVTGYACIKKVGASMEEVGQVRLPSVAGLLTLSEAQTAVKAATLSAALYENNYDARKQFAEIVTMRNEAWTSADAGWKEYEPLPQTPEEAVLWKQFVSEWETWKRSDADVAATIDALSKSSSEQTQKELFVQFFKQYEALVPIFLKAEDSLNKIVALNRNIASQSVSDGSKAIGNAGLIMLIAAILSVVVAIAAATFIAASIANPLTEAVKVAQTVAAGDLTSRITVQTSEETGQLLQALKDMNDSLVRIVGEVRTSTDTIATASSQIASGNLDLSSRTEEQASSLEETASSMEELTSTVRQNVDNARQANAMAVSASEVASKGGAVVSQVVETMGAINDSSKKIADIIGVIDGIAFQTNILALNAAVEAARAGEQGRGFAVVASEVRNLAQRSAAAAKEIKALIVDSVEKVEAGGKLVDRAGATMHEIVDSVKRVTDIMAEIVAASQEQSAGIEQINQAIAQMDEVTQQNASLVEEAAAASEALQDQSRRLAEVVSVFKMAGCQNNDLV
jgi:methyl-accepting chemotaxis protein